MGCYDISKGFVSRVSGWNRKSIKTSFCSSCIAGFFMTCTVAPWDMIRTKLMNQPLNTNRYSGFLDCLKKTIQMDGFMSLWRGFIPIWARFAPMATGQLLTLEFLYQVCGFDPI